MSKIYGITVATPINPENYGGSGSAGNGDGLTAAQIEALDDMFKVCAFIKADVSAEYNAFRNAFGISGEVEPDIPDIPDIPDEPDEPVIPDVPETEVSNETKWTNGVAYTFEPIANEYPNKSNGEITAYNNWQRSPYLYCAGASTLRGVVKWKSTVFSGTNDNAFYDADKKYVAPVSGSTFTFKPLVNAEVGAYVDIPIPENAAYFVVSGGNNLYSGINTTNYEPFIEYVPYE